VMAASVMRGRSGRLAAPSTTTHVAPKAPEGTKLPCGLLDVDPAERPGDDETLELRRALERRPGIDRLAVQPPRRGRHPAGPFLAETKRRLAAEPVICAYQPPHHKLNIGPPAPGTAAYKLLPPPGPRLLSSASEGVRTRNNHFGRLRYPDRDSCRVSLTRRPALCMPRDDPVRSNRQMHDKPT
jgi:hypothetical protein